MNQKRLSNIIFIVFLLSMIGCGAFLLTYSLFGQKIPLFPVNTTTINTCDWETASGNQGSAALPGTVPVNGFEEVTYRITLPEDLKDNEWLCLLTRSSLEIWINGELRKEFNENTVGISGNIEKSSYHFCELTAADSGTTAEVIFKSSTGSNGIIRSFYVGDAYSLFRTIMQKSSSRYLGIIILFVISLIGIITGLILSIGKHLPANIIYISIGFLLVSTWLILDDPLYPLFFPNAYVDGVSSYLFGVLAPFPFILYVDHLQKHRYHPIFLRLEIFNMFYFFAVCIVRFLFKVTLVQHLLMYNLPIILMCIVWLYPVVKDVIAKKSGNYQIMVYGLVTFMILTTIDIILINLSVERTDGNLILAGLYILALAALLQQTQDSLELVKTLDSQSQQITAISKQNHALALRVQRDPLTGLYNSNYLKTVVTKHLSEQQTGALLLFDLDNFKNINDSYGHQEGDRLLIAFAHALKKPFRHDDVVCRLGGDEFVVFITETATENLVLHKSLLIMDYLKSDPDIAAYHDQITASMGAAYVPKDGMNFEILYRKADAEMYAEKRNHHSR